MQHLKVCHPRVSFAQILLQNLVQSFIGDPAKKEKQFAVAAKSGSPMKLPYQKLKKFLEAANSRMTSLSAALRLREGMPARDDDSLLTSEAAHV
jgi:hypothetical protein